MRCTNWGAGSSSESIRLATACRNPGGHAELLPKPPILRAVSSSSTQPRSIAVIGGGITGLAAAHRLIELEPTLDVKLFEAGPSLGGVLQTERQDGYLLELSADNFITNVPWALDLCRRIGFGDQLIETREAQRRAFVMRDGRLLPVPDGFMLMAPNKVWPVLSSPILSLPGKLRMLWEWFVRRRTDNSDESLSSFVRRRFGREVFERLVQPLVGGIYTADSDKLSLRATLPRFIEMERRHGSLIRAVRNEAREKKERGEKDQESGARYSLFVAPREGMSSLVEALAARLPAGAVQLNSPVERITRHEAGGWLVSLAGRRDAAQIHFDAVIVASPAPAAAKMLAEVDRDLSKDLQKIPYAGSAVALLGYRRDQVEHRLDGFGFVVPEVEHRQILAGSFSSIKFNGRAPDGHVLLRIFMGGAARPDLVHLPDETLQSIVAREIGPLLGIHGEPELFRVGRWGGHMPQYHLGHVELVQRIEDRAASLGNLHLAGNAYHGVGIPNCIHSGEQAAERLVAVKQP
jgi:oxygen-dependent protoporphyrinogen oxidase